MDRFASEGMPFSVAVIDMDWHWVDIDPRHGSGWTGFSWNTDLIGDPEAFLAALHARGLTVSLRPERLGLVSGSRQAAENHLQARVIDKTFLGDRLRLTLEVFGGEQVVASVPAAEGASIMAGSSIGMACFAADCRTLTS